MKNSSFRLREIEIMDNVVRTSGKDLKFFITTNSALIAIWRQWGKSFILFPVLPEHYTNCSRVVNLMTRPGGKPLGTPKQFTEGFRDSDVTTFRLYRSADVNTPITNWHSLTLFLFLLMQFETKFKIFEKNHNFSLLLPSDRI